MVSFSESVSLMKKSFNILMSDKRLFLFPFLSTIAVILLIISFFVPLLSIEQDFLLYVMLFVFYVLVNFIAVFFNSSLYFAIKQKLQDKPYSISECIGFSFSKIRNIFLWSLFAATVGIFLQALRDKSNSLFGRLIIGFIGAAWSVASFFVIPIMVFEDQGPIESLKKSASLIKNTWGAQVTQGIGFGLIFFILFILGLGIGFALFYMLDLSGTSLLTLIALLVVYIVLLSLVNATLRSIFTTALYLKLNEGVSTEFDEFSSGAFK